MGIQALEAIPIEIPLKKDFGGSTYHVLKRCTVITRIRTDEGLVSEVYNGDNRDHSREIVTRNRQIALHMLAAVPHGSYVECFANPERDPIWKDLITNRPAIRNGIIEVPQGPGFGLELDQAMIKKYRIN